MSLSALFGDSSKAEHDDLFTTSSKTTSTVAAKPKLDLEAVVALRPEKRLKKRNLVKEERRRRTRTPEDFKEQETRTVFIGNVPLVFQASNNNETSFKLEDDLEDAVDENDDEMDDDEDGSKKKTKASNDSRQRRSESKRSERESERRLKRALEGYIKKTFPFVSKLESLRLRSMGVAKSSVPKKTSDGKMRKISVTKGRLDGRVKECTAYAVFPSTKDVDALLSAVEAAKTPFTFKGGLLRFDRVG